MWIILVHFTDMLNNLPLSTSSQRMATYNSKANDTDLCDWTLVRGSFPFAPDVSNYETLTADWQSATSNLETLYREQLSKTAEGKPGSESDQDIIKSHWKSKSSRTHCPICKSRFRITRFSIRHCRKCGDVFCKPCTRYFIRLSFLANPDPTGKLHHVCTICYANAKEPTESQFRRWTKVFFDFRDQQNLRMEQNCYSCHPVVNSYEAESDRLKDGFRQSLKLSDVSSWRSLFRTSVPMYWQRPRDCVPPVECSECQHCAKDFWFVRRKLHCCVCGCIVCSQCSSKDLLVYVPDEQSLNDGHFDVKLAVIKVIGCPEVEPVCCLYLNVCESCKRELSDLQVRQYSEEIEEENLEVMFHVQKIYGKVGEIQSKIDHYLPKYCELVDALDISYEAPRKAPSTGHTSNMQLLAKAQIDLTDHFVQFVTVVLSLKKLKPITSAQASLLKNLTKGKLIYYNENNLLFKQTKRRLEEQTPPEVLHSIQNIIGRMAINSAYISLKQLAYEAIHITEKYKLTDRVAALLVQAETVVMQELRASLETSRENAELHFRDVDNFLKVQLKQHRFIRLSRKTGPVGASHCMLTRCVDLLFQISMQLDAKSIDKNFKLSKEALKQCYNDLKKIKHGTSLITLN